MAIMNEVSVKEGPIASRMIVDSRTGQEIPPMVHETINYAIMPKMSGESFWRSVGTLANDMDDKIKAALDMEFNPADVRIRPDGNVYLDWTWYAKRLNDAFGRLGWGLIPNGEPKGMPIGNYGEVLVVWGHWLIINGVPIGYEIGECTYQPSNKMMSFGDAAAGAKSNALSRNCKMLGMTLDLWDPEWVAEWKKNNAETYKDDKGNTKWRKKGAGKTVTVPTQKPAAKSAVKEEKAEQERSAISAAAASIEAQVREKVLVKWNALCAEADTAGVEYPKVTDNTTIAQIKELAAIVRAAIEAKKPGQAAS